MALDLTKSISVNALAWALTLEALEDAQDVEDAALVSLAARVSALETATPAPTPTPPTPTPSPSPTLAFDAATATVAEGNSGTKTIASTVNLGRDGLTGDRVVNLAYGGSATRGVDYTAPDTITVAAGGSTSALNLVIIGDTNEEQNETVIITATLSGYGSVTATKTITITNDDAAVPPATIAKPTITQTSAAGSTPFGWKVADDASFMPGYFGHVRRATSEANLAANSLNGEAIQQLTPQDFAGGDMVFQDLSATPPGPLALYYRVGQEDGEGGYIWGPWSNVIQDVIAAPATRLSATNISNYAVLSNNGHTITQTGYTAPASECSGSTYSRRTGKHEISFVYDYATAKLGYAGLSWGVCPATYNFSAKPQTTPSPGMNVSSNLGGNDVYQGGYTGLSFNNDGDDSEYRMLIDLDRKRVWFKVNGVLKNGDPAGAGTGGVDISSWARASDGSDVDVMIFFGPSDTTITTVNFAPANVTPGFTPWDNI